MWRYVLLVSSCILDEGVGHHTLEVDGLRSYFCVWSRRLDRKEEEIEIAVDTRYHCFVVTDLVVVKT